MWFLLLFCFVWNSLISKIIFNVFGHWFLFFQYFSKASWIISSKIPCFTWIKVQSILSSKSKKFSRSSYGSCEQFFFKLHLKFAVATTVVEIREGCQGADIRIKYRTIILNFTKITSIIFKTIFYTRGGSYVKRSKDRSTCMTNSSAVVLFNWNFAKISLCLGFIDNVSASSEHLLVSCNRIQSETCTHSLGPTVKYIQK